MGDTEGSLAPATGVTAAVGRALVAGTPVLQEIAPIVSSSGKNRARMITADDTKRDKLTGYVPEKIEARDKDCAVTAPLT